MTRAIAQTYTVAKDYRAQITGTLLLMCAFMAVLYGVNIFRTISGTVALQKTEVESAALSSAVGTLDSEYLKLSRAATPLTMKEYGLSQGKVSVFISSSVTPDSVALSSRGY